MFLSRNKWCKFDIRFKSFTFIELASSAAVLDSAWRRNCYSIWKIMKQTTTNCKFNHKMALTTKMAFIKIVFHGWERKCFINLLPHTAVFLPTQTQQTNNPWSTLIVEVLKVKVLLCIWLQLLNILGSLLFCQRCWLLNFALVTVWMLTRCKNCSLMVGNGPKTRPYCIAGMKNATWILSSLNRLTSCSR